MYVGVTITLVVCIYAGLGLKILGDKGLEDQHDTYSVTPLKENAIRMRARAEATVAGANSVREACSSFNHALGKRRCHVECVIGDLARWAWVRGCSRRTWHPDVDVHVFRIQLARCLTNYLYAQRGLTSNIIV